MGDQPRHLVWALREEAPERIGIQFARLPVRQAPDLQSQPAMAHGINRVFILNFPAGDFVDHYFRRALK